MGKEPKEPGEDGPCVHRGLSAPGGRIFGDFSCDSVNSPIPHDPTREREDSLKLTYVNLSDTARRGLESPIVATRKRRSYTKIHYIIMLI
jgi:hypothetical protein